MPITTEETRKPFDLDRSPIADLKAQLSNIERHSEELINQGRPIAGNSMASEALHNAIADKERGLPVGDRMQALYASPQAQTAVQAANDVAYSREHGYAIARAAVYATPEYGTIYQSNVLVPESQYLGRTEKKSHLEVQQNEQGAFDIYHKTRVYTHSEGQIVAEKEIKSIFPNDGLLVTKPTFEEAKVYADKHVSGYEKTAAEENGFSFVPANRTQELSVHQQYQSALMKLEHQVDGLLRRPDVPAELKEAWQEFQKAEPYASRSAMLDVATKAVSERYESEKAQELAVQPIGMYVQWLNPEVIGASQNTPDLEPATPTWKGSELEWERTPEAYNAKVVEVMNQYSYSSLDEAAAHLHYSKTPEQQAHTDSLIRHERSISQHQTSRGVEHDVGVSV